MNIYLLRSLCLVLFNNSLLLLALLCFSITNSATSASAEDIFAKAKRVVVLGDSITYSGQYVAQLEAIYKVKNPERKIEFLNVGLPSETVSGLSEEGHAGGRFPRPTVHERLDRVLSGMKPDLILVNYGMNCGIYRPYSSKRFNAYRDGMKLLREKAAKVDARIVHITPPAFDPEPIRKNTSPANAKGADYRKPYVGYNEVLDLYSSWLLAQRGKGWTVIDSHFAMNWYLKKKRETDAKFKLAGDGVHINTQGHWLVAREILKYADLKSSITNSATPKEALKKLGVEDGAALLKLVQQKQAILRNSWLTKTKHVRPGIAKGVPLEQAKKESKIIDDKISKLLKLDKNKVE